LNESVDVRGFPFEIAVRMVGGSDVRVEEEFSCIGIGPVLGDGELGFALFDGGDEVLQGAVFAD
jgi:hypothetical protein